MFQNWQPPNATPQGGGLIGNNIGFASNPQSYPSMPAYQGAGQQGGSAFTGQPLTPPPMTGAVSRGPTAGPGILGGWNPHPQGAPHFGSLPSSTAPSMNGPGQRPQIDHSLMPGGFHVSPFSQLGAGSTTQHAPQSFPNFGGPPDTMSMGGRGGTGPIPAPSPGAPSPPPPLAGPQAATLGQSPATGYAGGGSSGYLDGSGNNGGSTPFQLAGTGPTITPQYTQQIQAEHAADPSFNRNNSLANFSSPFTGIAQNQGGLSQGPPLTGSMPGLAGANSFAPQATAASYRPITGYGNQGSGGVRV